MNGATVSSRAGTGHREYRTRLVADVVTGKLDVRAAAAKLPVVESQSVEPVPEDDEPVELEVENAGA